MNNLYAILPCYNEQENINGLIEKWLLQREQLLAQGYALHVVAIDDHSTDGTKSEIMAMAAKYPEAVRCIAHPENRGLSGGLNTAVAFFTAHGHPGDLLALMDGDNTQDPCYIHAMLEKMRGGDALDCVIASRYCAGSSTQGVPRHRVLFSDMARYYYRWLLRIPGVDDYTCGYRLYTYAIIRQLPERFGPNPVKEKTFACMMELLYKLYLVGARFGEVPFALRYDLKQGKTKMSVMHTAVSSLSTAFSLRHIKR